MPCYDYVCACGTSFEHTAAISAPAPGCPHCGGPTRRRVTGFAIGGRASAGRSAEEMPQTWRGTYNGDRDYVTELRREWDTRQALEEKYPELAGDRRPIVAHEGPYEHNPLRAGDPLGPRPPSGDHHTTPPHTHPGGHTHGPQPPTSSPPSG